MSMRGNGAAGSEGAPMTAVPGVSRFWTTETTNDSYPTTWENFALGRISGEGKCGEAESFPLQNGIAPPPTSGQESASPFLSAQIELFRNGDFITRSNNVESVYRRVIEPNPDPLHPYGPVQDLSVINETNAYCWVDIVVNNADAWVRFEGDGPSNLADPSFAAKGGETNHVVILIGKMYKVTCDVPFSIVGKSDPAIDERWEDDRTVWLNWPVRISVPEDGDGPRLLSAGLRLMGAGPTRKEFTMCVEPDGLGGFFSWTNSCCSVSGSGIHFSYSCDEYCHCTGSSASGYYGYEGYCIGCYGGWCGCSYDPGELEGGESEPEEGPYAPGISVVFSHDAVIFENEFQNLPGLYVGRRSSETVLECLIHGGPNGGTATFTFTGRDKLDGVDLPTTISVPANTRVVRRITYFGLKQSASVEDVVVHGHFQENQGDGDSPPAELDSEAKLTSIRIAFNVDYAAPENDRLDRHLYGVTETVHYHMYPDSAVGTWTFRVGGAEFFPQSGSVFNCPGSLEGLSGGYGSAELSAYGASFRSAFTVFEPQISARNPRINANPLRVSPVVGEAGHLLLYMDMYVEPSYVSFKGLQMREVPDESQSGTHQGYYDDTGKGGNWSHTSNDGAGPWNEVDLHGYYGTDEAGRRGKYEEPWSEGSKEWPIPMDWGRSSMTVGRFRTNPTSQGFVLHANGTFRIEKFNHSAERTISGQAWCDDNPVPR